MKRVFIILSSFVFVYASCKKEDDHDHDHGTEDTTYPVVTVNTPADSSVYHNGDTVFIDALASDNSLHQGTVLIKDDTTAALYYDQYPYIHDLTSAQISYQYVVSGITQNSAATLSFNIEDHASHSTVVTRRLIFMP